jgi:two-component system response regulator PilR (NtrC family)
MNAELLGSSAVMDGVRSRIAMLSALPWHVRIEGPSGSGKGVAARLLHRLSPRHAGPFIECDVNAMAEGLEVADLRGHTRGAFTGAMTDRAGLLEAAHGGTLFIDEIATASMRTQLALLQLVEQRTVQRIGECRTRQVDVRIVFATNANLSELVTAGRFRDDLLYRMGWLVVQMPALSEHREDIPELAAMILNRLAREAERDCPRLTRSVLDRLIAFDWPGNVRQLEGALQEYVAFGKLPDLVCRPGRDPQEWQAELDAVLERNDGSVSGAARELRTSRKAVYKALRRRRA